MALNKLNFHLHKNYGTDVIFKKIQPVSNNEILSEGNG
tara:strand:+ start:283 stop:396 length:114 start_codon:yes stop_codon:yes gene_type:complete